MVRKSAAKRAFLEPMLGGPLFPSQCSVCKIVGMLYGTKARRRRVGAVLRYIAACPRCGKVTIQKKVGPSWEEKDEARRKQVVRLIKRAADAGHDFGNQPYAILCQKCKMFFSNVVKAGYPTCPGKPSGGSDGKV